MDEDLFFDEMDLDIDDLDMIGDGFQWTPEAAEQINEVLKEHGWGGPAQNPVHLTSDLVDLASSPFEQDRKLGDALADRVRRMYRHDRD